MFRGVVLGDLMRIADDVRRQHEPAWGAARTAAMAVLADAEGSYTGMLAVLPGIALTWLVVTAVTFRHTRR